MKPTSPITWLRDHPLAADGLLAFVLAAIGLVGLTTDPPVDMDHLKDPDVFAVLLMLASTLPVTFRRRWPHGILAITGLTSIALEAFEYYAPVSGMGVLVSLYSVAAHSPDRRRSKWGLVFTMIAITGIYLSHEGGFEVGGFISNVVLFATAWILGDNLQTRRAYVRSLEERARLAEAEREEDARKAVRDERTRIARELHDVVAHSVSVMVVQAGAARRVLQQEPGQAEVAIAAIERTGRASLTELRRLLGMLREAEGSDTGRVPQPSIEHVDALVAQTRDAGLPVTLEVEGTPRPLPAGVDLSAYRIVQEALTNTIKHAGPALAVVRLAYGSDRLEITVSDDGRGADCDEVQRRDLKGHGIVGMQERVSVFGGDLEFGNRPGGGFTVRATLPLEVAG